MKAESDQKATLEEKSIQLEKQQVGQGHCNSRSRSL